MILKESVANIACMTVHYAASTTSAIPSLLTLRFFSQQGEKFVTLYFALLQKMMFYELYIKLYTFSVNIRRDNALHADVCEANFHIIWVRTNVDHVVRSNKVGQISVFICYLVNSFISQNCEARKTSTSNLQIPWCRAKSNALNRSNPALLTPWRPAYPSSKVYLKL